MLSRLRGPCAGGFARIPHFIPVTADIEENVDLLDVRYAKRGRALSYQEATITAVSIANHCRLVTCPSLTKYVTKPRAKRRLGFPQRRASINIGDLSGPLWVTRRRLASRSSVSDLYLRWNVSLPAITCRSEASQVEAPEIKRRRR